MNTVRDPRANIARLRGWVAALLFASMVINYLDRQTFNGLSPFIIRQFDWTLEDFGTLLVSFRIAYTLMQAVAGRLLDRVGTRRGLAASVAFYSAMSMLTAAAGSLGQFRAVRGLLGAGEAANWPGAIKASSEWFPAHQRASAVALFDSGTAIGGAGPHRRVGSLSLVRRLATGLHPHRQPRSSVDRRLAGNLSRSASSGARCRRGAKQRAIWSSDRQTHIDRHAQRHVARVAQLSSDVGHHAGAVPARSLLVFRERMVSAVSQVARFLDRPKRAGVGAPLAASVIGNFAGSALSNRLIARGWAVGRSRRFVLATLAPTMLVLALALWVSDYVTLIAIFSYANFAYAACSTMFLSLPADVFDCAPWPAPAAWGLGGRGGHASLDLAHRQDRRPLLVRSRRAGRFDRPAIGCGGLRRASASRKTP